MRSRIGGLLLTVLLLSSFGSIPSASGQVDDCGDNVCSGVENCTTCRQDCGACSSQKRCGDGLCHANAGESGTSCPEDCPEEASLGVKEVSEAVCGDVVCSLEEDCTDCPEDCGVCSYSLRSRLRASLRRAIRFAERFLREQGGAMLENTRLLLQSALLSVEQQRKLMGEQALERSEAAEQLLGFLEEHEGVQRRMSGLDTRIARTMGNREHASVLTAVPAMALRSKLRRIERAEHQEMVRLTQAVLSEGQTHALLKNLPEAEKLQEAARQGDLALVMQLLPPPGEDREQLLERLSTFRSLLIPREDIDQKDVLVPHASAEETKEKEDVDAKDAFRESVELTKELRKIAADPAQGLAPLDERLRYLQERRNTLAGVVRLPAAEVGERIQTTQRGVSSTSTNSLLNLVGLFRYLRSTANFVEMETTFTDAVHRMQSRMNRPRSLFVHKTTPQVQAASILEEKWNMEDVAAFQEGGDSAARREILGRFIARERQELEPLLQHLPEAKRTEFVERVLAWESEVLASAENPTELRSALTALHGLVLEAQGHARAEKNVFMRLLYTIQDWTT